MEDAGPYTATMMEAMYGMQQRGELTDVVLTVVNSENEEVGSLGAHRLVLCAASPYYRGMLGNDRWRESDGDVTVVAECMEAVHAMITTAYTGSALLPADLEQAMEATQLLHVVGLPVDTAALDMAAGASSHEVLQLHAWLSEGWLEGASCHDRLESLLVARSASDLCAHAQDPEWCGLLASLPVAPAAAILTSRDLHATERDVFRLALQWLAAHPGAPEGARRRVACAVWWMWLGRLGPAFRETPEATAQRFLPPDTPPDTTGGAASVLCAWYDAWEAGETGAWEGAAPAARMRAGRRHTMGDLDRVDLSAPPVVVPYPPSFYPARAVLHEGRLLSVAIDGIVATHDPQADWTCDVDVHGRRLLAGRVVGVAVARPSPWVLFLKAGYARPQRVSLEGGRARAGKSVCAVGDLAGCVDGTVCVVEDWETERSCVTVRISEARVTALEEVSRHRRVLCGHQDGVVGVLRREQQRSLDVEAVLSTDVGSVAALAMFSPECLVVAGDALDMWTCHGGDSGEWMCTQRLCNRRVEWLAGGVDVVCAIDEDGRCEEWAWDGGEAVCVGHTHVSGTVAACLVIGRSLCVVSEATGNAKICVWQ